MARPLRKSEIGLILFFLLVIFSVPIAQTGLEVWRGERAQFTDVLHRKTTAKNLRQYEKALEEKSWFQAALRPVLQRLLFGLFQETGSKAVRGVDGWLFYRPDLRYVVEPDRGDAEANDSRWVEASDPLTRQDYVVRAVTRFRDQLQERGLRLVVAPIPGKPSIYPDRVTSRLAGAQRGGEGGASPKSGAGQFISPTRRLIRALEKAGIEVVDLFAVFEEKRRMRVTPEAPLYLARDTHWTPVGASLAAQAVAGRLRDKGWAPDATLDFKIQPVPVERRGDILEMAQVPGMESHYPAERVECVQVWDASLGLMVPTPSDRPGCFKYPAQRASVLVLGDSFCRIYQYAEPKSLGRLAAGSRADQEDGAKRLLPGSAGFVSHLALALRSPVDAIVSDGGASTDVRKKLSTNPEILEGKQVVIWAFVERDINLGRAGWEEVPLPPAMN